MATETTPNPINGLDVDKVGCTLGVLEGVP